MTLSDYQSKLHKIQAEIQYLDQQRSVKVEEYIKTQGAIEALQSLNEESPES